MKRKDKDSVATGGDGMRRREFLATGARLGLMTSALALPNVSLAAAPPNILMIPIDDLNDWVGPLGGYPLLKTPNINRLANRGCVYKNAQSAVPACSPSRTSRHAMMRFDSIATRRSTVASQADRAANHAVP